eukprot:TRINITY_DN4763_c0_g1_i1.p1 TRINITY_DN4763_c0_g1~~TRINITY_DN4763_c0_g1_i1.p1  ORF type:complete len:587 (+),score=113.21 TRINITY_DN4763_c0_g1_i1:111-1871(+)
MRAALPLTKNQPLSIRSIRDRNGQDFIRGLEKDLGISEWKDWYRVSREDILNNGGGSILTKFNNSPSFLITSLLPHYPWKIYDFDAIPLNYWCDPNNQKEFMNVISSRLGISRWQDWYSVTRADIVRAKGAGLLARFNNSPSRMITSLLPEYDWEEMDFHAVPSKFWRDAKNRLLFGKRLESRLQIKKWEDWYEITCEDIIDNGGSTLLANYYGYSPSRMITTLFPEHPWNLSMFRCAPMNYWSDSLNQRRFLDTLSKALHVEKLEDWYNVTVQDVVRNGGSTLLAKHGHSTMSMLKTFYPNFPWKQYLFRQKKKVVWSETEARQFLEEFAAKQNIVFPSDWSKVSKTFIKQKGGASLLNQTGSLRKAPSLAFPSSDWSSILSLPNISKPQRLLHQMLLKYLPDLQVNYKHPLLCHEASGRTMELDFFSKSHMLGIEYQGEYHYSQLWQRCQDPEIRQYRDAEKAAACRQNGIVLIAIPYWWDQTEDQLLSTIRAALPNFARNRPEEAESAAVDEENYGTNAEAKAFLLGSDWKPLASTPDGWWISEKYNGFRAKSGRQQGLQSRQGQFLGLPMLSGLLPFDGEVW